MKKIFIAMFSLLIMLNFTSCLMWEEPNSNTYCWLADPQVSCHLDKAKKEYNMRKGEFVLIYLVFACNHIQPATCSFNGGEFVDVSPKSCEDRFTKYILSPDVKIGENTFVVRIDGKEIKFSILVNLIE